MILTNLTSIINGGLSKGILWRLPLVLFPFVFYSPVLLSRSTNLQLVPGLNGLTDALGLVRVAQMAPSMVHPLGQEFWTNYPSGELLWNLSSLTQTWQFIYLWLFGKFLDPFFVANTFLLLGWLITGLAVFELSKSIGLNNQYSLAAGISSQFLPGLQLASATVPSLAFSGIPVFVLALIIRWSQTHKYIYFVIGSSAVVFSALFDGYIYYFSFVIFWVAFLIKPRVHFLAIWNSRFKWLNVFLILSVSALPLAAKLAHLFGLDSSGTTRGLVSPSPGLMQVNGFSILQFFQPHPESIYGVGFLAEEQIENYSRVSASFLGFVIAFFVLVFIFQVLIRRSSQLLTVLAAATIFFLLSLKAGFSVLGLVLPNPTIVLLWFFPGLLYVDRTSFVLQNLAVVMCFGGIWFVFHRISNWSTNSFIPFVAMLLIFVEMMPLSSRVVVDEYSDYENIRSAVNSEPVLFLPETFLGRGWIQQVFVDAPMANSLQHPFLARLFIDQPFPNAPEKIACSLAKSGIKFVLLEQSYLLKDPAVRKRLVEPYFSEVSNAEVSAFEKDHTTLSVLSVHSNCQRDIK